MLLKIFALFFSLCWGVVWFFCFIGFVLLHFLGPWDFFTALLWDLLFNFDWLWDPSRLSVELQFLCFCTPLAPLDFLTALLCFGIFNFERLWVPAGYLLIFYFHWTLVSCDAPSNYYYSGICLILTYEGFERSCYKRLGQQKEWFRCLLVFYRKKSCRD